VDQDLAEFVRDSYPKLLRRAYLLTGDARAAEDLVQDCLARCWAKARTGRIEDLYAYTSRVLINSAVSGWRRRSKLIEIPVESVPEAVGHTSIAEQVAERDRMWRVLLEAPPGQRAVLVLRYYEDLPEAGVAALLGISVGSVRSQTAKGLAAMRKALAGDEHVGGRT